MHNIVRYAKLLLAVDATHQIWNEKQSATLSYQHQLYWMGHLLQISRMCLKRKQFPSLLPVSLSYRVFHDFRA